MNKKNIKFNKKYIKILLINVNKLKYIILTQQQQKTNKQIDSPKFLHLKNIYKLY